MPPHLPSHEEIERTVFGALGEPGGGDPETRVDALGYTGRAALARALNAAYELELGADELACEQITTVADVVLLVRLHVIQQAVGIPRWR